MCEADFALVGLWIDPEKAPLITTRLEWVQNKRRYFLSLSLSLLERMFTEVKESPSRRYEIHDDKLTFARKSRKLFPRLRNANKNNRKSLFGFLFSFFLLLTFFSFSSIVKIFRLSTRQLDSFMMAKKSFFTESLQFYGFFWLVCYFMAFFFTPHFASFMHKTRFPFSFRRPKIIAPVHNEVRSWILKG